jgi:3-methyl-2-oxobutanoate hydroxymethyltransferase
MRGAIRALVVVDMPFGSYEGSREHAYISAARIMRETGCQAVKLETGAHIAPTVRFLAERGIPVMGHVGLLPQSVHADGGFKAKGRSAAERERILGDARAVAEAGAFAVVLEGIAPDLADEITASVQIPTIGIGASRNCDGQVLVIDDMLGLFDWTPKFVRRYANLREQIAAAAAAFARDVRSGDFPGKAETYEFKSGSP